MFDILNLLPADDSWFSQPDGVIFADVCVRSGYLAGPDCPEVVSMQLPESALESESCPYHHGGAFALPPTMEWYYRPHHPEYVPPKAAEKVMEFIYPGPAAAITLPHLPGGEEGAVFRVAHRRASATLWWHLDGTIVGETTLVHSLRLAPAPGRHVLTVVDDEGETATVTFTVL